MAEPEHLAILRNGAAAWNRWRRDHADIRPDLSETHLSRLDLATADLSRCGIEGSHLNDTDLTGANLSRANLSGASLQRTRLDGAILTEATFCGANLTAADMTRSHITNVDLSSAHLVDAILRSADLTGADLSKANVFGADLSETKLRAAKLRWTNLTRTNLHKADLRRSDLTGATIIDADLSHADLRWANLRYARVIDTNVENANFGNSRVYGISAWNLNSSGAVQSDLIITPPDEATITVDNLEVAQFVYVLLNSAKIRELINTITLKVVLILGRFSDERFAVLDALRDALRKRDYLPIVFDFAAPANRDLTETISTLAHLARFVIADITYARSIPQELMAIVPNLPSVPVQPLLLASQREYGLFEHFNRYPWVLKTFLYESTEKLLTSVDDSVIGPAEAAAREHENP